MKVAIMQPYFFPYIGYFQLLDAVDLYIVHDRIKYVKKGWINRNRILQNGRDAVISVPLENASDALDICERNVAKDFDREKLLNRITEAYRKAPLFQVVSPVIERIVRHPDRNLFQFLHNSLVEVCAYLAIDTEIVLASSFQINPSLKGQDMVIALCRQAGADVYVNAIGGVDLYSPDVFRAAGLDLRFIRSGPFEYRQFDSAFVPSLSIIDVMMFCDVATIGNYLRSQYELFTPR